MPRPRRSPSVIRALGRRAVVIQLDITDQRAIRVIGPSVRDELGRLDVWVNNAGADILTGAGASLSPTEKLELLLAVDLKGTILASWHAAELFGARVSRFHPRFRIKATAQNVDRLCQLLCADRRGVPTDVCAGDGPDEGEA